MTDPAQESTIAAAMAALALVVVTGLTVIRPMRPAEAPAKMEPARAEPWMADCLPGIGPARRDAAAEAIRAGGSLPTPAATAAMPAWFAPFSPSQTDGVGQR
ncbi:hypothetical protein LBMAG53_18080 [Planctomycetota bacterium]|nr:hypothetical protein LBMAG53_18080 [Planctomycetota bacterium]